MEVTQTCKIGNLEVTQTLKIGNLKVTQTCKIGNLEVIQTFYKLHFNSEAKGLISMGYTGGPFYRNKLVQRTDKVGLVVGICQIYLSELYTVHGFCLYVSLLQNLTLIG